jgi:hypothetical protein
MKCRFCGNEIEDGSLFCGYCGKEQPKVKACIKCGREIDAEARFCDFCGASQTIVQEQKLQQKGSTPITAKSSNEEPTKQESAKTSRKSSLYKIVGAIIIVIFGCIAFYIYRQYKMDYDAKHQVSELTIIQEQRQKANKSQNNDFSNDESQVIKRRLENIFSEIASMERDGYSEGDITEPDKKFLTKDFLDARKLYIEGINIAPGSRHFWMDMWTHAISGQIEREPSKNTKIESVDVISEKNAKVNVVFDVLNPENKPETAIFILLKVNGEWLVDDIINEGSSTKESCRKYYKDMKEL